MGIELEIEAHFIEVFLADGCFAQRTQLMEDHSVFSQYFVHFRNKLFVVFFVLVVVGIATLVAAEFFIRTSNECFVAKQAILLHDISI